MAKADEVVIEETMKAGVYRQRRRDDLERWKIDGEITPDMFDAARRFQHHFESAGYRMSAPEFNPDAVGGGHPMRAEAYMVGCIHRGREVAKALGAVGQIGADICWHVLGEEYSLRQYGTRAGIHKNTAKARLFSALELLVKHYGLRSVRG